MRAIETPEMLGRIVLTEGARQEITSQQMEVVAIGASSICDESHCEREHEIIEGDCTHPIRAQPGWWVLIAPRSLTETDTAGISCVHQDDVLAVLTEKAPV